MQNGPELWRNILKGMPPGAIIAGGAVRDFLLHEEPKDIDVFMAKQAPNSFLNSNENFYDLLENDEDSSEYQGVKNLANVYRGELYGFTVDVIEMEKFDPAEIVGDFDYAIHRSWFDGQIHETPEAMLDRMTRSATLLNDKKPERARDRFRSFNRRHGEDWTLRKRER